MTNEQKIACWEHLNKNCDDCRECRLIRITESDNFIVDYDKERSMYRVSHFEDCHFQDEFWFDAYEERELPETNYCQCKQTKDKDEYWGYWVECECGYKLNITGATYCGGCGKRIQIIGTTSEFTHYGER